MKYENPDFGIVARWKGGAYIDLYWTDAPAPFHCLNVWNYETDTPVIPFTEESLAERVQRWLREDIEEEEEEEPTNYQQKEN